MSKLNPGFRRKSGGFGLKAASFGDRVSRLVMTTRRSGAVIFPTKVPLMTRLACAIGFHQWTRWTAPYQYPQTRYVIRYQSRTCAACGKTVERRASSSE